MGSCAAGASTSTFTVTNNESYAAYVHVEYSLDGGSTFIEHTLAEDDDNLTLAAGSSDLKDSTDSTVTLTISVAHGQTVIWRATGSPTTVSTGAPTASTTESSEVSCPVIDPSVRNTRDACQNGSKLSHFHMENSSSANVPAYFLAEYSLDGGTTWESLVSNQEVGINGSEFASVAVPDGQQIRWRYKTSTTSNSFTGSYSYWGPDFLVDCGNPSVSASLGSCADGSATSTFLMLNLPSTSTTVYFEVQYKVTDADGNDLAWTAHPSGSSVSVADSASSSLTHSIDVGQKITWRYRTSSQDGTFSGSYTETSQSSAVSCDINPGASQALASSCSGSSKNSTLTLTNASPTATTTAYFLVEYSTDNGSTNTQVAESSKSVAIDGSETVTQAVSSWFINYMAI